MVFVVVFVFVVVVVVVVVVAVDLVPLQRGAQSALIAHALN